LLATIVRDVVRVIRSAIHHRDAEPGTLRSTRSRVRSDDLYQRQPTWATYLGIHSYDDRLDDYCGTGSIAALHRRGHFARG
jgi:hypothetical protein